MVANGLSEPVLKARGGGMGWGLANVNVVLDPGAVRYPANRGEYGWDGSAGTIFWIDPGQELIAILMTQSAPADPDGLRGALQVTGPAVAVEVTRVRIEVRDLP